MKAMTKAVSTMTMKVCLKTSQGTQYKGASNYIGRQEQPQLGCGVNGMLEPNTTYYYCKDTRHNCVQLNNKIVCELKTQEQVTASKPSSKKVLGLMFQNIIAPQILDQSGDKVCGPDWIDKRNHEK